MKTCAAVTGIARLVQLAFVYFAAAALAQNATNRGAPLSGSRSSNDARDEARPIVTSPSEAEAQRALEARLSPWTAEIVRLTVAGIEESVILSFIDNSGTFGLGADELIYLTGVGVSPEVMQAMLQHDYELGSGQRQETITTTPQIPAALLAFLDASDAARKSAPPVPTSPSVSVESGGSIIATRPAEDSRLFEAEPEETSTAAESHQHSETVAERYPVRKAYPVRLTVPIVMYRAAAKTPNVVVVEFGD